MKKWWNFRKENDKNLYTAEISELIEFLTKEFNQGGTYGTLNTTRSALSLILGPEIADDFRVKRFFKGISNIRPALPKYDVTWDPQIILNYFSNKPENNLLSLEDLSKKLITLLSITTGHRMQTYGFIEIENIEKTAKNILIKIPKKIKTSKRNGYQPVLNLPYFKENPKICVASTLETYLKSTKEIRGSEKTLFISFKKPYKAVGKQTLSRWVKCILSESGINTDIFSAHSTRHAASSAAKRNGVSLDVIRKAAGWTEKSKTFAKFYDREIVANQESFALAILK